jgi:hypothetical protein
MKTIFTYKGKKYEQQQNKPLRKSQHNSVRDRILNDIQHDAVFYDIPAEDREILERELAEISAAEIANFY